MAVRLSIRVPGKSRRVLLWEGDGQEVSVGRSARADLQLPDSRVSGLHLVLRHDPVAGTWHARDEGSLNGTRLNGRQLTEEEEPLAVQDRIELGRLLLTVEALTPPGQPTGTEAPPGPKTETTRRVSELLGPPPPESPKPGRRGRPGLLSELAVLAVGLAAAGLLVWTLASG